MSLLRGIALRYENLKEKHSVNIISRLIDKNILIKTTKLEDIPTANSKQDLEKQLNQDQQVALEVISQAKKVCCIFIIRCDREW